MGNKIEVMAKFPEPGLYELDLFAESISAEGSYECVATNFVTVGTCGVAAGGCPETNGHFHEAGCVLLSPLTGVLHGGHLVSFAIRFTKQATCKRPVTRAACRHIGHGDARQDGQIEHRAAGRPRRLHAINRPR